MSGQDFADVGCGCEGHRIAGVSHVVACCDQPHIDAWDAPERNLALTDMPLRRRDELVAQAMAFLIARGYAIVAPGLPDSEGWVCQSCGADNYILAGFARVIPPEGTQS